MTTPVVSFRPWATPVLAGLLGHAMGRFRIPFPGSRPEPRWAVLLLACLISWCAGPAARAADSPRILSARPIEGRLLLDWDGTSYSYEVQRTTNLSLPQWNSVLATARTNASLALSGSAAYFRVIDPDTNLTRLELVATNQSTGDVIHLVKQVQTNADLVFFDAANATDSLGTQRVIPGEEQQKFDLALDGPNFAIVTPQGQATAFRGNWLRTPGPDPGETTYFGTLTDGTATMTFWAVAADPALSVGDAAFSAWWCAGAWAAQALQCQAAAQARTLGCVGFFPPKPRAGYGYISSRSGVTLTGTNIVGSCESKCVTCCKDNNTGALSDCTP